MDIIIILGIIIVFLSLYFLFGIFIKLLWAWLPLIIGVDIIFYLGINNGILNAIFIILIFLISLFLVNNWQGNYIYFKIENIIDSLFCFKE